MVMKSKLPEGERLSPNHSRKLSEVLFEFTGAIVPLDSPPDLLELAVGFAVLLWNVALLPEPAQTKTLDQLRQVLARTDRSHWQLEIERLLELRRTRYASDRRLVLGYRFAFTPEGPRLVALSADLDAPEDYADGVQPSPTP